MTHRATGTFEVTMKPIVVQQEGEQDSGTAASSEAAPEPAVARGLMSLHKVFSGDLAGTGEGQLLTAMTQTRGSAGYVAMELVSGTLHGKQGSFVFQHSSTMSRGEQHQSITIVPDSGTGELTGIQGSFVVEIAEGEHRYVFEYTLPDQATD